MEVNNFGTPNRGRNAMLPLGNHPMFRATTTDEFCAAVESRLGVSPTKLPSAAAACDVRTNHCALPIGALLGSSYGVPVTLSFPESENVAVHFRYVGSGQVTSGAKQASITAATACVACAAPTVDFGDGYELVWRIPTAFLVRKLAALTGRAIAADLTFDPAIDLTSPKGKGLQNLMMCLVDAANDTQGAAAKMMLTELERALGVALLCVSNHSHRHLLDRSIPSAAPWQVHRVESYIEANWSKPLRMDDIVAVTGVSARSIFRTFARYRGYSPMEFLKQVRLQHAQRMLCSGDPDTTVTEVALSCGFSHLSRFTEDYRAAFGDLPSAVLKRHYRH